MTSDRKPSKVRTTKTDKKTEVKDMDALTRAASVLEAKAAIGQAIFLGKNVLGLKQIEQLERIEKSLEESHERMRKAYEKEQG